jgi:hypothetical protein
MIGFSPQKQYLHVSQNEQHLPIFAIPTYRYAKDLDLFFVKKMKYLRLGQ